MSKVGVTKGGQSVRRRVATTMAFHQPFAQSLGPGHGSTGLPAPTSPPTWGVGATAAPQAGTSAPVTPPPPGHDATYNAGIANVIQTRKSLTAKLATNFTNDNAGATVSGNKAGLLHSSALANKLAELKTNFQNDQGDIDAQYGTGENYGIQGGTLLGDEQQRHAGDPQPTVVDNATLASLNAPANAASPNSHVQLASGWSILYDASGKPIKFLPPGQKA